MRIDEMSVLDVEQMVLHSARLDRDVTIDFYAPAAVEHPAQLSLLLINDGQDLPKMPFNNLLGGLFGSNQIEPLICIGIHCGPERKMEYGTAGQPDYEGRGAKADLYHMFVIEELLPFIHTKYCVEAFRSIGMAGFSLGGLTAMDMVWSRPDIFSCAGIFSGSLWWRTKSLADGYNEDTDRIMHQRVRAGNYHPGLRFYFTTGSLDERADRNSNGVIDSIDDTLALIMELEAKGYDPIQDIRYINYQDGKHDVPTWGRAMPGFLLWGWGNQNIYKK